MERRPARHRAAQDQAVAGRALRPPRRPGCSRRSEGRPRGWALSAPGLGARRVAPPTELKEWVLKGKDSNVRLQKLLAEAGVASRRASERIILAGRVTVNGQVVCGLGRQVDPAQDKVAVDGRPVSRRRKLYLALNKPAGYVCTCRDPQQRPVAGSLLPAQWRHVYPVGRLDRNTEGLLLLSNDGEFSLRLTHPRYGVPKRYLATIAGQVEAPVLARLTQGVWHQGEQLRAKRARLIRAKASRSLVEVEVAEGKNHEVRRLFAAQGLRVERLQRTQIGPLKLGQLPLGKWRVLSPGEVAALCEKRDA